jgi:hypothetical protein
MLAVYPAVQRKACQGGEDAGTWVERFRALGEKLRVRVE